MARAIKITNTFSLPLDVVTQTITILAKRRVGKSYTMRRIVEQLLHASQQVVIVDPKGDQWGIRSSADGKKPGFPVLILGGEHGDLPLEKNSGELVAKLVVEEQVNILLDVSQFSKGDLAFFMAIFLEQLYRLKAQEKYRTPMMLVVDEADAIAPQKPQANEARMLGAIDDIVRRGGQRGIGTLLITQRSAVLNKNVLTQSQMLVVLRLIAPQDIAAMKAWIDVHGTDEQRKELLASVPSLPIGDAYFWSPGWPTDDGIFKRGHVLPIETFDSAATPKPGQKCVVPKNLADVNLKALEKQMASTIEKAKAEDPKELKKRIAVLEAEAKKRPQNDPAAITSAVGTAVAKREHELLTAFEQERAQYRAALMRASETLHKIQDISKSEAILKEIERFSENSKKASAGVSPTRPERGSTRTPEQPRYKEAPAAHRDALPADALESAIGKGEIAVLTALAQFREGATREHLTVLTGYKKSTRNRYIQYLQQRGFVELQGERILATQAGIDALGPSFAPLPTGPALQDHLLRTLPEGEAKILRILIDQYPNAVDRESITEQTNYQKSTRNRYIQYLAARELVQYEGNAVRATSNLF